MNKVTALSIRRESIEKLVIYNIDAKEALENGKVPESNVNIVRKIIARNNVAVAKFIEDVIFASELN